MNYNFGDNLLICYPYKHKIKAVFINEDRIIFEDWKELTYSEIRNNHGWLYKGKEMYQNPKNYYLLGKARLKNKRPYLTDDEYNIIYIGKKYIDLICEDGYQKFLKDDVEIIKLYR